MDQEQLLALIQYLGKYGMSEKDIMSLFGGYFGLSPDTVDTSELFAQYMPTFQQINQFDSPDSLRQSIAKEVMSGTPIWQIQQGIANAISEGDPGVEAGQTLQDYVSLAKALQGEYQSYQKQLAASKNDTAAGRLGITSSPQDQYTPEMIQQMFPEAMNKLAEVFRQRPVNTTMDAGLAARYAADSTSVPSKGTIEQDLDAAKTALSKNVQNYTYKGKTYSLSDLRDNLIPMLASKITTQSQEKSDAADYAKSGVYALQSKMKQEGKKLFKENQAWANAQQAFRDGRIDEKALRRAQLEWTMANETAARLAGEMTQRKAAVSAAESPKAAPTRSASGTPIAPKNFGPGSATSARTTTVDPFALQVAEGVVKGIQNKLASSGRTPYSDQMRILALMQRAASGK